MSVRARALGAVVLGAAGLLGLGFGALSSCNALSGIDGLRFDLDAGSTSGGAGAGAGGGGAAGGGQGGSICPESVVVGPMQIDLTELETMTGPIGLAARAGWVGVAGWASGSFKVLRSLFATANGSKQWEDDAGHPDAGAFPDYRPTMAAGADYLILPVPLDADANGTERIEARFHALGQWDHTVKISTDSLGTGRPIQARVTAGTNGYLVTGVLAQSSTFFRAVIDAGGFQATAPQPFQPGTVCCCTERSWAVAPKGDGWVVAWVSSCASDPQYENWRLAVLDGQGALQSQTELDPLQDIGAPRFGGVIAGAPYVANCRLLALLDGNGAVSKQLVLPDNNGGCRVASTGTALRWLDNVGGMLHWRSIDPNGGLGPEVATLGFTAPELPALASDGDGFALAWLDGGQVQYARVGCVR